MNKESLRVSPHGVSDVSVLRDPQQLVWPEKGSWRLNIAPRMLPSLSVSHSPGDGVQIGAEAVVKVCVGLPYLLQHLDVQGELKNQS